MEKHKFIKSLPALQVILHPYNKPLSQAIEEILQGGISWIQYRNKDEISYAEKLADALLIREKCLSHKALYIVNDSPQLALESQADGVHLGKEDMSPTEARKILGSQAIIGGTANTMDDVRRLHEQGVDYIGLGPFRFTNTKKNLSPVLGIQGYQRICEQCDKENIHIPLYAIGGIQKKDISPLMHCGMAGIAVSALILDHEHPFKMAREIVDEIKILVNN